MIYDIYHDECKENGYWHCYIFIPREKAGQLYGLMKHARENIKHFESVHYKNIRATTKSTSKVPRLIESWLSIFNFALQQQRISALVNLGNMKHLRLNGDSIKIGAKLVIIRERECLTDMFSTMSFPQKIEAVFRMGLKGGLHYLFTGENITVGNLYMDLDQPHLEVHNITNMLDRVKNEVQDNINFEANSKIIPLPKTEYDLEAPDTEFMQLTDIVIGAFRTQFMRQSHFRARYYSSLCLKELIEKDRHNSPRMRNSRYLKAYLFTDAWIEDETWNFEPLVFDPESVQMELFS